MSRFRSLGIAAVVLALLASPAFAGKDKKKQKDKDKHADAAVSIDVSIRFSLHEQEQARDYFVKHHGRGKCPPGLAKKNNGCLPPGQAKKRYALGHPLPPDIVLAPLPHDLEIRLGPPPRGYRYGLLDGDVVKLAVGTALVVDAIAGLVN
ncbi:MAG: hypothetical protein AB7O37_12130 [Vicinamibacteria bacterium]